MKEVEKVTEFEDKHVSMNIFHYLEHHDYEQVIFCQDKTSNLKAIIAIHDTTLGPALGGVRMWDYENEDEAVFDALRLAKGMTYKNAAAGLKLGGGKAVIIGNPQQNKNEEMFRVFGRYIQSLNGRYITAEDVGTTENDMALIHSETDYVTGISPTLGGSGDPSPVTAYGVYCGIKAAVKEAYGTESVKGLTVAVQGVGNVAYHLLQYLYKEEAQLIVTDINKKAVEKAVREFGAKAVEPDEIYDQTCDIFSPCALGGVLNDETLLRIKAKVIAGSANNQLKEERHGDQLHQNGILYAPDYVINSGGVINIADELLGDYNQERAMKKVEAIYGNTMKVFEISKRDQIPTYQAADRMAEERIEKARQTNRSHFLRNPVNVQNRK